MKKIFILIFIITSLTVGIQQAHSESIPLYMCGESRGYEYFFGGLLTNGKPIDFEKGNIKGWLTLVADTETKNFNIVFKDATGIEKSAKDMGADVLLIDSNLGDLIIAVRWGKMAMETYYFRQDQSGAKEVLYTLLRGGVISPKGHIFKAKCE